MGTSDAAGSNFGNSSIFSGHQDQLFNYIALKHTLDFTNAWFLSGFILMLKQPIWSLVWTMIPFQFHLENLPPPAFQKFRGGRLLQRLLKSLDLVSSQCPRRIKYKRIQLQSFWILAVMWPRATTKKRKIHQICFSKPFSTMEYPFIINVFARKNAKSVLESWKLLLDCSMVSCFV